MSGRGPVTERHTALEDLTTAVRRLVEATVATGHDVATLRDLTDEIDAVAGKLESERDDDPWMARSWGPGAADPGALLGINPALGRANPTAPVVTLDVTPGGRELSGTVRFGLAHVGPPYRAHGGVIASVFDQVLGVVSLVAGAPGMTRGMSVTYRRATPLHEDVRIEATMTSVDERGSAATARLIDAAGNVTAEAEATFTRGGPK